MVSSKVWSVALILLQFLFQNLHLFFLGSFMMPLIMYMRQSKLDCLFSTTAILLLHVGRWFIFIIHCHFLLLNFENLKLV